MAEEARMLQGDDRNTSQIRFDSAEAERSRYPEREKSKAQNNVIARWKERGIWSSSWGGPWPVIGNPLRHSFIEPEPGSTWLPIQHHPALVHGGAGQVLESFKKFCCKHHEQSMELNGSPHIYPEGSCPFQMLLAEVERKRETVLRDQELCRRRHGLELDESELNPEEIVQGSWREDELWSPAWIDLPGGIWPHEKPDKSWERLSNGAGWKEITVIMPDGSQHIAETIFGGDVDLSGKLPHDFTRSSNESGSSNTEADRTTIVPDAETYQKAKWAG
jgi:hypothetical protein